MNTLPPETLENKPNSIVWTKGRISLLLAALLIAAVIAGIPLWLKMSTRGIPKDWSAIAGNPDQWRSSNDGKIQGHTESGESLIVSKKVYRDVTLSAVVSSTREASFALRVQDASQKYVVIYVPPANSWQPGNSFIELIKMSGDEINSLGSYHGRILSTLGNSAKITSVAKGPWIEVLLNDVSVIRVKDTSYSSGFVGLRIYGWGDHPCDSTYSNLRFY